MGHYETLGVPHDANSDAISKAYRKLALKHHPDRNLNDQKASAEKFKKVSLAFEVLSDKRKRADYDLGAYPTGKPHPGWTPKKPKPPPPPPPEEDAKVNINDIKCEFIEIKGRGRDVVMKIKLTAMEMRGGCRKVVHIKRRRLCDRCVGDGKVMVACPACGAHKHSVGHCRRCDGYGAIEETCGTCNGQGVARYEVHTVSVKISPCNVGHVVTVLGEGEHGKAMEAPGNLRLIIEDVII